MSESSENFPKVPAASSVEPENTARSAVKTAPAPNREKFIEQALADFESPLIGYATTILNDLDRARDVVQDTFGRLCQQDIGKVEGSLKSWLFTVCRNRALDILRKEKRTEPLEDIRWKKVAGPGLQPDEQADHQEKQARLNGCLERLSAKQREVIILKFQQDLSYQEIHEITGLTTGNIGFLIHTGLKRLRDILPDDLRI
ncbi:MAG: sigma-70 family RNA polymerase sigma factor [Verrucomicrobiota bacterium]